MNLNVDVDWFSLPNEIWQDIGKHLEDNRLDVIRFRSVCKLWRSSIPPFNSSSAPTTRLRFPYPYPSGSDAFISVHAFYRIELAHNDPDLSPPKSPSSFTKGCLVKFEESELGEMRFLNPFTSFRIRDLSDKSPKFISLLKFRIIELTKGYALRYIRGFSSIGGINKVIMGSDRVDGSSIFLIYDHGKLGFAQIDDKEITLVDDKILDYNDMVVHKGKVFVVDKWGTVSWVDSSLRVIQSSPPLFGVVGVRKHLVVSCGELYVMDRYIENKDENMQSPIVNPFRRRRRYDVGQTKTVDFKIYKLEEELGRLVEVKNLSDRAFILSVDCCLSVSAEEVEGVKENCIYFTEQLNLDLALRGIGNHNVCVFSLEDCTIKNIDSSPGFLPPPSWFCQKTQNQSSCSD